MTALDAANSDLSILLAELPVIDRPNVNATTEVNAINAALPSIVSTATGQGIDAALVDFSSITTNDLYDGLHPDEAGTEAFAAIWLNALLANSSVSGGTFDGTEITIGGISDVVGSDQGDRLNGNAAANNLNGAEGDDLIDGAQGNDILTGGLGRDVFVFAENAGLDTITDFDDGSDLIDVTGHVGVSGFNGIVVQQMGNDAVIYLTGLSDADRITLENVSAGDIDGSDFIFA